MEQMKIEQMKMDLENTRRCLGEARAELNELEDRMAVLVKAQEDELLVRLPCKAGEIVYYASFVEHGIFQCRVQEVHWSHRAGESPCGSAVLAFTDSDCEQFLDNLDDFKKTVFPTPAEAEAVLLGMLET